LGVKRSVAVEQHEPTHCGNLLRRAAIEARTIRRCDRNPYKHRRRLIALIFLKKRAVFRCARRADLSVFSLALELP
jgi:hypothetical protein